MQPIERQIVARSRLARLVCLLVAAVSGWVFLGWKLELTGVKTTFAVMFSTEANTAPGMFLCRALLFAETFLLLPRGALPSVTGHIETAQTVRAYGV